MPIPKYPGSITPIKDGDEVKASTPMAPISELAQRTEYLKGLIDAIEGGSILISRDLAMEADAEIGHAVYWNVTNARCERALATVEDDTVGGYLRVADSAYVIGIVASKSTATIGNVVMLGNVTGFDFSNAVSGTIVGGVYFLSATTPGMYTRQSPPISVLVCTIDGSGGGFIQPAPKDMLESHVHYRFELQSQPAGVPNYPGPSGTHSVTVVDTTVEGWLPADDATFNSLAPSGAVFGYNITTNTDLARIFPPIPPENASIVRHYSSGLDRFSLGDELITEGDCPLVVIDPNGIWWMSNEYGQAPWSTAYGESSPSMEGCEELRYVLWFTKMMFKTAESVVTSIQPADGSPLVFRNSDGSAATRGDIYAGLDMTISSGTAVSPMGGYAYKEISGLLFRSGPVVAGIRSASTAITVSGAYSVAVGSNTYYFGSVLLDFTLDSAAERELMPQVFGLDNVRQENDDGILYLGMPQNRESSVRMKISIPDTVPSSPKLRIRVKAIGFLAVALPNLTVSYRRVPVPASGTSPALPAVDTVLAGGIPLAGVGAISADDYVYVNSADFTIAKEDIVFVTLTRSGDVDGYAGDVGILEVRARVVAG